MIRFGSHTAREVANAIIEAAQKVPHSPLKKLLLCGSIAEDGIGPTFDLVLEVDLATFENYLDRCEIILDGVRPLSADMFRTDDNEVFSVPDSRSAEALAAIGVNLMELYLTDAQREALDIECLPEGWDDAKSEMHRRLLESLATCDDPNFLERVMSTRIQLFPRAK